MMAIYRNIPQKDIRTYEPKIIGPFTWNQLKWSVPGIGLGLIVFFTLHGKVGDIAYLIAIVAALPFLLCGYYKPYGTPFKEFAARAFVSVFLAPTKRKYSTVSVIPKPAPKKKKKKASNTEGREL